MVSFSSKSALSWQRSMSGCRSSTWNLIHPFLLSRTRLVCSSPKMRNWSVSPDELSLNNLGNISNSKVSTGPPPKWLQGIPSRSQLLSDTQNKNLLLSKQKQLSNITSYDILMCVSFPLMFRINDVLQKFPFSFVLIMWHLNFGRFIYWTWQWLS